VPIVNPDAVKEVGLQPSDVKPAQVPEKSSTFGLLKFAPTELRVIVGSVDAATNLYHTSYRTVPLQEEATPEEVAFAASPAVLTHVVDEVNKTAFAQSSFEGCARMIFENKINMKN
jgi:hypothetical protein